MLCVGHLRQWTTAHEQPRHSVSNSIGLVTATWTLTACVDRPVSIRWSSRERHTHCAHQTRSWRYHTVGSVPRKTHLIKTDKSTLANQCPRRQSPDHWSRSPSDTAVHVQMTNTKHGSPGDSECSLGKYNLTKCLIQGQPEATFISRASALSISWPSKATFVHDHPRQHSFTIIWEAMFFQNHLRFFMAIWVQCSSEIVLSRTSCWMQFFHSTKSLLCTFHLSVH